MLSESPHVAAPVDSGDCAQPSVATNRQSVRKACGPNIGISTAPVCALLGNIFKGIENLLTMMRWGDWMNDRSCMSCFVEHVGTCCGEGSTSQALNLHIILFHALCAWMALNVVSLFRFAGSVTGSDLQQRHHDD
eukprot:m.777526 g.777526  ORF g.777526 m.777526 type:complete len:135 (+) comp23265_c1_seq8:2763-3167(+)